MSIASYPAGTNGYAARPSQAAVGDHSAIDASGSDGSQRVGQVKLKGAAADGGVVYILGVHVQVVGQVQAAVANAAGSGEQALYVVLGQPGVLQGFDDALALNLQFALIRSVAGGVLVNADNCGGTTEINHN